MSQENVEFVKTLLPPRDMDLARLFRDETNAAAVIEAFAPRFHSDVEVVATAVVQPRLYSGLEGLRAAWVEWLEPWESYRTEIEDILDVGDDVVVLTRDYGRRRDTVAEVSMLGASVWTVRDGKVARACFYPHRDDALEAVGLSE